MAEGEDEDEPRSRRGAVVGLAVIAAIIVAVLLIMNRLHRDAAIQDCVAAGRTNCAPIGDHR